MHCPICGKELRGCRCADCGFDLSQRRELYPTIVDDGNRPAAIWVIREQRSKQLADALSAVAALSRKPEPEPEPEPAPLLDAALERDQTPPDDPPAVTTEDDPLRTRESDETPREERNDQSDVRPAADDPGQRSRRREERRRKREEKEKENKKRRMLDIFHAVLVTLSAVAAIFFFTIIIIAMEGFTGSCGADGDNLSCRMRLNGVLEISGSGAMEDYGEDAERPWDEIKQIPFVTIERVEITGQVTNIGDHAFSNLEHLTAVTIPETVTDIGEGAFRGCTQLSEVTIPETVSSVGKYAFRNCNQLSAVTIPEGVTDIKEGAFFGCGSLSSVALPASLATMEGNPFGACERLVRFSVSAENEAFSAIDGVLFNKDGTALIAYPSGRTDSSYQVPEGVTKVGHNAFFDCRGLQRIELPDSLNMISNSSIYSCDALEQISVSSENKSFAAADGVLFKKDMTKLIAYPSGRTDSSYMVPAGVTILGATSFWENKHLTAVVLPDDLSTIEFDVFFCCENLESITIPGSLTEIGKRVFEGCERLTDVYYTGTEAQWAQIRIGENNEPLHAATVHYIYGAD